VDATGERATSGAFLVPRWGGVAVVNVNWATATITASGQPPTLVLRAADLQPAFTSFVLQLRTLLGVCAPAVALPVDATLAAAPALGAVAAWEADAAVRRHAVAHVALAGRTLTALHTLLESMPRLPVTATVAAHAHTALASLMRAVQGLRAGAYPAAAANARAAAAAAEAAFADPTLLAQQYFPEEYLYAVYLPLGLPVALPVVVALLRALLPAPAAPVAAAAAPVPQ
jgi:GPI-anchor transamidase subunit S